MTVEKYISEREESDFVVFTVRNYRDIILYDTRETPYEPDASIMEAEIECIYSDGIPMLEVYY